MSQANQVTVTAKVGPGLTTTSQLITEVRDIKFDMVRGMLYVNKVDGHNTPEFDIRAITAVTFTISGINYTISVS